MFITPLICYGKITYIFKSISNSKTTLFNKHSYNYSYTILHTFTNHHMLQYKYNTMKYILAYTINNYTALERGQMIYLLLSQMLSRVVLHNL